MSNKDYHLAKGISSSAVKSVYKKSVAHWKGEKRNPDNPAFALGNAVHANLLEKDRNLVVKGPKTKNSIAFKEMKEKITGDQVLLTEVEFNVANCITKGVLNNPICAEILKGIVLEGLKHARRRGEEVPSNQEINKFFD